MESPWNDISDRCVCEHGEMGSVISISTKGLDARVELLLQNGLPASSPRSKRDTRKKNNRRQENIAKKESLLSFGRSLILPGALCRHGPRGTVGVHVFTKA